MFLPYAVYVLFSEKDNLLYVGFSTNVESRLKAHNDGKNLSTKYRTPLKLIFCELYLFKMDALNREKYFKTSMGKKALRLMLNSTFTNLGYKGIKPTIEYLNDDEFDL